MTALFASLVDKQRMFNVLKHVIDVFFWDRVSPEHRGLLKQHIEAMEAFGGTYEVHSEIARGKDMKSMKLVITLSPVQANG